jgi:oxidase EvaA
MNSLESWVDAIRATPTMLVDDINLNDCEPWSLRNGSLSRPDSRFFRIIGIKHVGPTRLFIDQPEVGLLGFVFGEVEGQRRVLVQAKDEPGNRFITQLAPTVQATKSNFEAAHGGVEVPYFEYFTNPKFGRRVLNDSQSSEHGERFWKKQNRNLSILVDALPPTHDDRYSWFPVRDLLDEIDTDYLINTDARSVLSATPWQTLCDGATVPFNAATPFVAALRESFESTSTERDYSDAVHQLEHVRARSRSTPETVAIDERRLIDSTRDEWVRFIEVRSRTREVTHWCQPIYETRGVERHQLVFARRGGELVVILRLADEPGLRTEVEWSTTTDSRHESQAVRDLLVSGDVVASLAQTEEGSRFYCSEARFDLIDCNREIDDATIKRDGLAAVSLGALNRLLGTSATTTNELRTAASLILRWV